MGFADLMFSLASAASSQSNWDGAVAFGGMVCLSLLHNLHDGREANVV